jgi:hypothetical protein
MAAHFHVLLSLKNAWSFTPITDTFSLPGSSELGLLHYEMYSEWC